MKTNICKKTVLVSVFFLFAFSFSLQAKEKNSADLTVKNLNDQLATAVNSENIKEVTELLNKGANANTDLNDNGLFPLVTISAADNNYTITKLLLEHKAKVSGVTPSGDTPLLWAIANNSKKIVNLLISHDANVNDYNKIHNYSAIFSATQDDNRDMVELLLKYHANPDLGNRKNSVTPLMWASKTGNLSIIKDLLSAGAKINIVDNNKNSALMYAVLSQHPEVVHFLLQKKANPNIINKYGDTPLIWAAHNGANNIVKELLEAGANPNQANEKMHSSPLIYALLNNHMDTARVLLKNAHKLNVNSPGPAGKTALMIASSNNNASLVKKILNHGANINAVDKYGQSALFYTSSLKIIELLALHKINLKGRDAYGNPILINLVRSNPFSQVFHKQNFSNAPLQQQRQCMKILLSHGANINETASDGTTPLMLAASNRMVGLIKFLIANGAKVNKANKSGDTALKYALNNINFLKDKRSFSQAKTIVKILLSHRADPNISMNKPSLLMMTLQSWGKDPAVKSIASMLVEHGANVDSIDQFGHTALFTAVENSDISLTEFLLAHNANTNIVDRAGYTPLLKVLDEGYNNAQAAITIAKMLLNHGANPNVADEQSALDMVCGSKWGVAQSEKLARMLLAHKANINGTNKHGDTALIYAIRTEDISMIAFLLDNGANPNIVNKRGETALSLAARSPFTDMFGNTDDKVLKRTERIIQLLINHSANINVPGNGNAFMNALVFSDNNLALAHWLLKYNPDINIAGYKGNTPLMWAAFSGNVDFANLLIKHGANINARRKEDGMTALLIAASKLNNPNNVEVMKALLSHHADVHVTANGGNTFLKELQGYLGDSSKAKAMEKLLLHYPQANN